jgi:stage III sporulation protein AA
MMQELMQMKCAWKELLGILPHRIRVEVDKFGQDRLQEIRMRLGRPPELVLGTQLHSLTGMVTLEDLSFVINTASSYSPWSAETLAEGYITAPGGHRVGICGHAVVSDGSIRWIRDPTSVNIRVAKDIHGIADRIDIRGNLLILGPPGSGKTTLLRDLCRRLSDKDVVCVVDERSELFPMGIARGRRMDVMTGCGKSDGIDMVLRSMGPMWIAVDEVTARKDSEALENAGWCGVHLIATVHAESLQDLKSRPQYRPLWTNGLFEDCVIMNRQRSWHMEKVVNGCSGSWALA